MSFDWRFTSVPLDHGFELSPSKTCPMKCFGVASALSTPVRAATSPPWKACTYSYANVAERKGSSPYVNHARKAVRRSG